MFSAVAPRVGAWIETKEPSPCTIPFASHPVWVRGLKLPLAKTIEIVIYVAPRVGAWIETLMLFHTMLINNVAPRVGAWIETTR